MTRVHHVGKPRRWDEPFGTVRMPGDDIARVLSASVFKDIDPSDFPPDLSLQDIIANDSRIVRFERGQIVVRRGDYGNSLFVILKGKVRGIATADDSYKEFEHEPAKKVSVFQAISQLWRNSKVPESRRFGFRALPGAEDSKGPRVTRSGERADSGDFMSRIEDVDSVIANFATFDMGVDEPFGELAALTRSPRSTTLFADEDDTELLELRWQGFRDIRDWSTPFRERFDELYRLRGLAARLRESALFANVGRDTLRLIAQNAQFETHGNFEWTHAFQREASDDKYGEGIIEHEPLIVEQGHYLEGLLIIHSGFARVSEQFDHGERTIGYLAKDDVFGLHETVRTMGSRENRKANHSLRAIGYVDVIRIPTHIVEQHLVPHLPDPASIVQPFLLEETSDAEVKDSGELRQSLLDFFVDRRFINGTKAMVINTDRCVNCDDCVRACAVAHDNNPRFIRHGHSHENLMVANACMHCVDAVCLIGCPTGAIHRETDTGNVVIDDTTCVGCQTCANSCPYNNIRMADIRDPVGAFLKEPEGDQILRATKCDFCSGQLGGPACQRACPHDALIRIDIRDTETLNRWLDVPS